VTGKPAIKTASVAQVSIEVEMKEFQFNLKAHIELALNRRYAWSEEDFLKGVGAPLENIELHPNKTGAICPTTQDRKLHGNHGTTLFEL